MKGVCQWPYDEGGFGEKQEDAIFMLGIETAGFSEAFDVDTNKMTKSRITGMHFHNWEANEIIC